MTKPRKAPSYLHHQARNIGRVRINGHDYYLPGEFESEESLAAYHRIVGEWLQTGALPVKSRDPGGGSAITINEFLLAFFTRRVVPRYMKDGKPTSERRSYATALAPLKKLYGFTPASDFTPAALIVCRQELIAAGLTRKRINQHVGRIRRAFKWGVQAGMIPAETWHALLAVDPLWRGEAQAESRTVPPAPEAAIAAVEQYVTPPIWAMIQTQLWTAARPGEVCAMRSCDITASMPVGLEHVNLGGCLLYVPGSHKTEHHGKRRLIFLGPKARAIIEPWLRPCEPEVYLFSPAEGRRWFAAKKQAEATTPRKRATGVAKPGGRKPREKYDAASYGRAIRRACIKAGVEHWHPHQLRHNAATRLRAEYGVAACQIILGHASITTTEGYAEPDWAAAVNVIGRSG